MSTKDLIVQWEEAVEGVLQEESLELEVSIEELELTAALPRVKSELRAGRTQTGLCCGY